MADGQAAAAAVALGAGGVAGAGGAAGALAPPAVGAPAPQGAPPRWLRICASCSKRKAVPDAVMDLLAEAGYTTMARFAVMEDSRAELRKVLAAEFGLDPAADRKHRLAQVTVLDAWEIAARRQDEDRRLEAEAKAARLPKVLGTAAHLALRRVAEAQAGAQADTIAPGAQLVELVMEQIEEAHHEAIPLTRITAVSDSEEAKTTAVIDVAGVARIKSGRTEIKEPGDPEEYRGACAPSASRTSKRT